MILRNVDPKVLNKSHFSCRFLSQLLACNYAITFPRCLVTMIIEYFSWFKFVITNKVNKRITVMG